MKEKRTVLGIGAHPDDLEILCGGTLAKYAKQGDSIFMAHILNGDKGHQEMDPAKLSAIREKEAEESGRVIGAEVISLGIPDGTLVNTLEMKVAVLDLIRRVKPDIILTHSPEDYISDHYYTATLVTDASFYCTAPLWKTTYPACRDLPYLFYMDTLAGVRFLPTEYVDISGEFEAKLIMLKKHKSQMAWLKDQTSADIIDLVTTVGRYRGLQCGVKYAEAFQQYQAWTRNFPGRLLP